MIPPSLLRTSERRVRTDQIRGTSLVGLHFKTKVSAPLPELFHAGAGPLLAVGLDAISHPVLGLARLDGWVEDIRSVLDLEVEGVV
jgi:hypothetical protein